MTPEEYQQKLSQMTRADHIKQFLWHWSTKDKIQEFDLCTTSDNGNHSFVAFNCTGYDTVSASSLEELLGLYNEKYDTDLTEDEVRKLMVLI